MNKALDGIKNILDTAKEKISKFENKAIETIQNKTEEKQPEKRVNEA